VVLATIAAFLAMPGVFTFSKVFFVRDLATSFLPYHLWFRRTVLEGQLPFWNPYLGCGYSTLSDPVFQNFFPLTLPLRLLPPTIGFNLIVALPVGVAALGTYCFLRRHVSPQAASFGAIVFSTSGPFLSTASMPNLSWSCACIPWVLAGIDGVARRPTVRCVAALSAAFGLMLLAGEPATFAAMIALATAYSALAAPVSPVGRHPRTSVVVGTLAAAVLGVALAAIQIVPAAETTARSIRAAGMLREMWSLHPARLVEAISPFFFGKYVGMPHEITQWLFALNDRRGPLLISLYIGAPVLLIALLGAILTRRSLATLFWCSAAAVALVAAFGSYTPVYPAVQRGLPVLALLRYPSKYLEFSTLAVAILAALGWDALSRSARIARRHLAAPVGLAAVFAVVSAAVLLLTVVYADSALVFAQRLATNLDLPSPSAAAHSLTDAARATAPRLLALSVVTGVGLVLAASSRREASVARGALFALICADLILANAPINPTIDASVLAPFDWVKLTQRHPEDRVFVSRNFIDEAQAVEDAPRPAVYPPDTPPVVYQAVYDTALGNDLSPSAVRLTLSREMTGLRPREYVHLLQRFGESDRAMRYRFLSWAGTRFYLVASAPPIAAVKLTELPALGSVALYESPPTGARVFVTSSALVEPNTNAQIDRLFEPGFALASTAIVDHEPPLPAGSSDATGAPQASIVEETTVSLLVRATAPEGGGYLLLLDSFDPNWNARVDGHSVPLLRADGVFRAVRLPAGRHAVQFAYRPRAFVIGASISFLTALILVLAATRRPRLSTHPVVSQ
jgi:hypothetical protein